MIHPKPNAADVQMFIWKHLQISVQIFAKSIGRSLEDAIIFVHLVLQNMLEKGNANTSMFNNKKLWINERRMYAI